MVHRVGLVLVTLFVLAGCGSAQAGSSSPSASSHPLEPSTAYSVVPSAAPSATGVPSAAAPSTAAPSPTGGPTPLREISPVGNYSIGWTLDHRAARDTDLLLTVAVQACRPLAGAHVTLTATAVTIAVLASAPRPGLCSDLERLVTVLVRAPEPIGTRQILHARLGR